MKKFFIALTIASLACPLIGQAETVLSKMTNKKGDQITYECSDDSCGEIVIKLDRSIGKDFVLNKVQIENSTSEINVKTKNQFLGYSKKAFRNSLKVFLSQGAIHETIADEAGDQGIYLPLFPIGIAIHGSVFVAMTSASLGVAIYAIASTPIELLVDSFDRELIAAHKINKKLARGKNVKVNNKVFEEAVKLLKDI